MRPARRIRVLHVITRMIVGGAQENTLLTATRLDPARYDITLASGPTIGPEGTLEPRIPGGLRFVRVPELVRDPHPIKDPVALARLYGLVRAGRFDIVHTHTTKAGLLGRIAAICARVPVIVHTPHGHAFHGYLGTGGSSALRIVERALTARTTRVICLTDAERQDHLQLRIGAPEKFSVVHSGVDLERFRTPRGTPESARRALGLPENVPLIGCVARLVPVKGVQHLLDAVPAVRAAVPGTTVVFVGDGPLRGSLQRTAAARGLDRAVVFLGLRDDVPDILPLFDVVALPSLNEGMGRAAVEALAAGRPVVGSRISGIQNVVADGETGILVRPGDSEALAGAIVRCLRDLEGRRAMGARGQRSVDGYGIDAMVEKIDQIYTALLAARSGPRSGERANSLV
ncbi:MAG TPA: glycosyltransferase family 4 protein [bacterium]|nr:glycosyltransferase family 4 protein [bacterium]